MFGPRNQKDSRYVQNSWLSWGKKCWRTDFTIVESGSRPSSKISCGDSLSSNRPKQVRLPHTIYFWEAVKRSELQWAVHICLDCVLERSVTQLNFEVVNGRLNGLCSELCKVGKAGGSFAGAAAELALIKGWLIVSAKQSRQVVHLLGLGDNFWKQ